MGLRNQVGDRRFKFVNSVMTLLIAAATCGLAVAQERRIGGPTPSAAGAEVYFIDLKDGATVQTKLTIRFGLRGMGVAPAGADRANSGHHNLLIDTELPALNQPIASDFNHLHFGAGQTETEITLKPGTHTLQLLLGDKDHNPHNPPVVSPRIRVVVTEDGEASTASASPAPKTPARASPECSKRRRPRSSRLLQLSVFSRLSLLSRVSSLLTLDMKERRSTPRRSAGRAAGSNGCVERPRAREIRLRGDAVPASDGRSRVAISAFNWRNILTRIPHKFSQCSNNLGWVLLVGSMTAAVNYDQTRAWQIALEAFPESQWDYAISTPPNQ
jgi:hypothetical protein